MNGTLVTEPAERWFDGHGIRIHGLDWGGPEDGQPVLMLHGVTGNAWIWDGVARRLRALLPDRRIVAIDQRDGGDSDHPPEGYGREDFAADVDAVHDALGGRPMILVGHSRGGWLSAWYAATRPARVQRLVLADPARLVFRTSGDADRFYEWVRGSLGPFDSEAAALDWARAREPNATWTDVRVRSFLFGFRRLPDGRLVSKLPPEVVPHLRGAREQAVEVTEALPSMSAPTLLLVATRQSESRVADKLAYLDVIPDIRAVRFDTSHFLQAERPDEVAAAIADFVRS